MSYLIDERIRREPEGECYRCKDITCRWGSLTEFECYKCYKLNVNTTIDVSKLEKEKQQKISKWLVCKKIQKEYRH